MTKDELLIETNSEVKSLRERMDRHSADHSENFRIIRQELKEIREDISRESSETSNRLTKLETERNIGLKIIVPIVSAIFGFFASFFSNIFHRPG